MHAAEPFDAIDLLAKQQQDAKLTTCGITFGEFDLIWLLVPEFRWQAGELGRKFCSDASIVATMRETAAQ